MKLEKIEEALRKVVPNVYYGSAKKESESITEYIVFGRDVTRYNNSKMSTTDYYDVAIVMEGWISEETIQNVIKNMREIGFMRSSNDIEFKYLSRNDTNYEICSINFYETMGRTKWL